MSKIKYCFSTDGEGFGGEFDTVEEALEEARQPYQGAGPVVYVGENEPFKPSIDGVGIIEAIQEQAYGTIGEEAESYLENVNRDDIKKLGDMVTDTFNRWAKETRNEPNIFVAVNVKGYEFGSSENSKIAAMMDITKGAENEQYSKKARTEDNENGRK